MKLKPSGYVPTWEDNPEKFKSRMKRRIAQAEAKEVQPQEVLPSSKPQPKEQK